MRKWECDICGKETKLNASDESERTFLVKIELLHMNSVHGDYCKECFDKYLYNDLKSIMTKIMNPDLFRAEEKGE